MDRLTIVYVNGNEEKYQILQNNTLDASLHMLHFKQLIENDMLKLVIDHAQIQLIPLAQIRKIIITLRRHNLFRTMGLAVFCLLL